MNNSFFTSVSAFFMSYLNISDDLFYSNDILSKKGMQICAKYLIDCGVFEDEYDMRKEALKSFSIILPQWIFQHEKE